MINIERVISKTPMVIADYFTEDGLLKQVGLVKEYWNRIVVKELTDNALDAIEPLQDKKVFMDVTSGSLGIYDNGTGIKKETVEDIYDFENYVSQNRNYITASRGKQGNGLKTIISICYIQGYRLLWHTAEGIILEANIDSEQLRYGRLEVSFVEIIYSLHQILKSNCVVLGIDIPTNGTILDEKFAYELNEFSKNMYDLIENNENKIIAGVVKRYNHLPDRCIAMLRISRNFHDNNPEKAYEFYKERMPNVCVEIMSEKISEEEFQKQYEFSESSKKIAYSGRAKSLNCNFYCDSGHHKIVYTADDNKEIKCPLIMHYDGNISISAYCSRCHWNENVVGNVFDGKSLREMITEWNYRTPLTCDEACELEEFRMLNDLKEKSERRDFYSKIGGTELSEEKIEKATFGKEFEIFYLENYRLKLHERVPALTTDEIENISIYALDLVRSKKEMSEEEYKNAEREMDIEISRMAFEHLYDDIKEVHERLPYLTPEECQEWFDCWKRWSAFQDNKLWNILTFDYVMRGWKLEELNDQREKNMSSLFDYIVLGNQEGKIKDGSE